MMIEPPGWNKLVSRVVAEVMEKTVFTEVREEPKKPALKGRIRGFVLPVREPVQGEFRLLMSDQLLRQLTGILYGSWVESIDEQIENDFQAELLNTIAGRLLAELLPSDQSFQLGLPENQENAPDIPALPCQSWHFTVEGQPLILSLHGESLHALRPSMSAPGCPAPGAC